MFRLLSIGLDVFSSLAVLLLVMILMQFLFFKYSDMKRKVMIILFAVYLSAVFSAVGIPSIYSMKFDLSLNVIPFIDVVNSPMEYIKNTVLNIVLFVPFGFLLPTLWKDFVSIKRTAFAGFCFSLFIEIIQITTYRTTDIDDLITNTMGALAGYCIFKALCKKPVFVKVIYNDNSYRKAELFIIFIIVFLIMFIIQPLLSDVLWDYVLSSSLWEALR